MAKPQYITQLRGEDLAKMLAAGNMKQGRGIIIRRDDNDAYTIEIDPSAVVDIIWCFVRQGLVREGLSGAACVVSDTAKNTRDHVKTDPNQFT